MVFFWLLLYGAVSLLSRYLTPLTPWAAPVGLLICAAPMVLWLWTRKPVLLRLRQLSLTHWRQQLFFLPYLLPVIHHLVSFEFSLPPAPDILVILLAAVLEEVIFRGIFPLFLCRRGYVFAAALSSLAFAAAHWVNLESGAAPAFVLCQILFALAAGIAFFGIMVACGSLLPCMAIHFLINLTAPASPHQPEPLLFLCIALYPLLGIHNIHIARKSHYERVSI